MTILDKETLMPVGAVLVILSVVWSFSGRYHSLEDRVQSIEKSQINGISELKDDVKDVKRNLNDIQRVVDRMDEKIKNSSGSNYTVDKDKNQASIRLLEDFIKSTRRPKSN